MSFHSDTSGLFRLFWAVAEGGDDCHNYDVKCPAEISRRWFRKGQWHHVAAQWDREAVRFYLDAWWTTTPLARCPSCARPRRSNGHRRQLPRLVGHVRRNSPLGRPAIRSHCARGHAVETDPGRPDAAAQEPQGADDGRRTELRKAAQVAVGVSSARPCRRDRLRRRPNQTAGAGRQGLPVPAQHAGQGHERHKGRHAPTRTIRFRTGMAGT